LKKAQRWLFYLTRLKKFGIGPKTLRAFYRGTAESLLTAKIPEIILKLEYKMNIP
jgi:hypothetical protein